MSVRNPGESPEIPAGRPADMGDEPGGNLRGGTGSPSARVATAAASDQAPETELWAGRGDWKYQLAAVLLWVVTAAAALFMCYGLAGSEQGWLRWIAWIVILIVGLRALWIVVSHVHGTRYRLTTQRLFVHKGILSRTTDQVELIRVDDVRVHQRLPDRIFRIGSVEVLSTDVSESNLKIVGIRDPDRVAEHIREHMRALRKKSLFIESL